MAEERVESNKNVTETDQTGPSLKVTQIQSSSTVHAESGPDKGSPKKNVPKGWEARYWDLFDHARDLIHIYDPEGRFTAVNKRWLEVLGYTLEEAMEMTLPDIVHPDLLAACLATFVNFDKGISYTAFESMFVAKDGHTVYVTGTMVPYRENDKLVRTRHIFQDVSFSKQAEAVLKSLGEGLVVTDKERKITLSNKAAEKMLGKKTKELLGQKWPNVLGPKGITDEEDNAVSISKLPFYTALTKSEKSFSSDYQYVGKEGKLFPVTIAAAPVILAGEITGVVEVFRDITREKASDRAKSEFIMLASHQLRTPLTSMKLFIESIKDIGIQGLADKQKEYMNGIGESVERMISLVNDLLNISGMEAGQSKALPKPTQLEDLIDDLVNEAKPMANTRGCSIVFERPKEKLPEVSVDPVLLWQAIDNLLVNALQYTPDQGGSIIVSLKNQEDEYIISVKDNGIGIPKEVQSRIFEKFFRADNAIKKVTDNPGLGLYVAKTVIDKISGRIWFSSPGGSASGGESEEEGGTTFSVAIPKISMKTKKGEKTLAN